MEGWDVSTLPAILAPQPAAEPCAPAVASASARREDGQLGLQLQELQVVHVTKSQAQLAGFQPGDVIAEINGVPVYNMDRMPAALQSLLLLRLSQSQARRLPLPSRPAQRALPWSSAARRSEEWRGCCVGLCRAPTRPFAQHFMSMPPCWHTTVRHSGVRPAAQS